MLELVFDYYRNDVVWGGRQAELLVAQQALALQTDEHKALPPAELQSLVKELLNCSPYYAEAVRYRSFRRMVHMVSSDRDEI